MHSFAELDINILQGEHVHYLEKAIIVWGAAKKKSINLKILFKLCHWKA